jgi:GST-like protein
MSGEYVLYGGHSTGAVAVEAALRLMGQAYRLVDLPNQVALTHIQSTNPMRQVPALTFPDGETMTESAAILIRLGEVHPEAGLAPGIEDPRRGQFLRWMSFISSAIYAHYWLKDDVSRLVPDLTQHGAVNARLEARILECWGVLERQARPGRYILGDDLTVLDLYAAVVSRFRPRRRRVYEIAPHLGEAVRRVDADPRLAELWAERYPFTAGWEDG